MMTCARRWLAAVRRDPLWLKRRREHGRYRSYGRGVDAHTPRRRPSSLGCILGMIEDAVVMIRLILVVGIARMMTVVVSMGQVAMMMLMVMSNARATVMRLIVAVGRTNQPPWAHDSEGDNDRHENRWIRPTSAHSGLQRASRGIYCRRGALMEITSRDCR